MELEVVFLQLLFFVRAYVIPLSLIQCGNTLFDTQNRINNWMKINEKRLIDIRNNVAANALKVEKVQGQTDR